MTNRRWARWSAPAKPAATPPWPMASPSSAARIRCTTSSPNQETGEVIRIPNTLLISAIAVIEDVRKCVTMDLKSAGNPDRADRKTSSRSPVSRRDAPRVADAISRLVASLPRHQRRRNPHGDGRNVHRVGPWDADRSQARRRPALGRSLRLAVWLCHRIRSEASQRIGRHVR